MEAEVEQLAQVSAAPGALALPRAPALPDEQAKSPPVVVAAAYSAVRAKTEARPLVAAAPAEREAAQLAPGMAAPPP